jgi:DNA-binding response OmpR family regulator
VDPRSRAVCNQEETLTADNLNHEEFVADRERRRVLLVDDTPEVAQLLTYALHDRGYDVAASGYTTNIDDLVVGERADAVVLNCSVYNMSESLFDILRDHPASADLPVVIISDTPQQADASLGSRNAKHVLLVPKPFTGSQIARALDELLARPAPPTL